MSTPLLALIDANMKTPLMVLIISVVVLLAIWDGVWKLIAMWKSARNNQLAWFICLAIFNTVGLTRPDGHLGGGGLKESAHE